MSIDRERREQHRRERDAQREPRGSGDHAASSQYSADTAESIAPQSFATGDPKRSTTIIDDPIPAKDQQHGKETYSESTDHPEQSSTSTHTGHSQNPNIASSNYSHSEPSKDISSTDKSSSHSQRRRDREHSSTSVSSHHLFRDSIPTLPKSPSSLSSVFSSLISIKPWFAPLVSFLTDEKHPLPHPLCCPILHAIIRSPNSLSCSEQDAEIISSSSDSVEMFIAANIVSGTLHTMHSPHLNKRRLEGMDLLALKEESRYNGGQAREILIQKMKEQPFISRLGIDPRKYDSFEKKADQEKLLKRSYRRRALEWHPDHALRGGRVLFADREEYYTLLNDCFSLIDNAYKFMTEGALGQWVEADMERERKKMRNRASQKPSGQKGASPPSTFSGEGGGYRAAFARPRSRAGFWM
ncbi:hypothetical protein ADUPG1_014338 [Aduncisulcus paluster]|uniref:J domain-containing protein n=1 Tax=Aduncisulcus paluster TaxID=2918883 RepID=A0ABQ5KCE3_9EUKA|nr:hypothetical protein ADUPG1_014338 [Aduncisulcus paluster]